MKKLSGLLAALIIAVGGCGCSAAESGTLSAPLTESVIVSAQSAQQASYIGSSGTQSVSLDNPPLSFVGTNTGNEPSEALPEISEPNSPAVSLTTSPETPHDPSDESSAETPSAPETENVCMFSISCAEALETDAMGADMRELLPPDGAIFAARVEFSDGETVFDVLRRVCRENRIHMESSATPLYGSVYIEGIANLYEFDCGVGSGWVFTVNGVSPSFSSSSISLSPGDVVEWKYTVEGIE